MTTLLIAGCSGNQPNSPPAAAQTKGVPPTKTPQTITISAAASTKDVVEAIATDFQKQTGAVVHVNAGPSSSLAQQILADAPADLFLSANRQWADAVSEKGKAEKSLALLTNKLVLVVPKGNPAQLQTPQDLTSPKLSHLALAGEKVPAGMYADQALEKLGLLEKLSAANKIVRGQDVRTALAYVERGEAEAGIVYSTDVLSSAGVETIYEFDPKMHEEIVYVLVLLKRSEGGSQAAQEFYDFLASPTAAKTFLKFGFQTIEAR